MTVLRLVAEYLADPIFCPELEKMGHISIDDLPISEHLRSALKAWNEEYQATFNDMYPPDSGFSSRELKASHAKRGKDLAELLQLELGDKYRVEYQC